MASQNAQVKITGEASVKYLDEEARNVLNGVRGKTKNYGQTMRRGQNHKWEVEVKEELHVLQLNGI